MGDGVDLFGVRVGLGVAVVDAVHVFGEKKDVCVRLAGAQRRARIRRAVRVARAAGEDDDAPKFKVAQRLAQDERLGDADHVQRRLHAGGDALLLDGVLHGERIDDGGEHPHVIRRGAVHVGALPPPPEIAAAQHDADLHAHVVHADELVDDPLDDRLVQAEAVIAGERLAGELEDDPLVNGSRFHAASPHKIAIR